jgi:ABC-type lipoprotein export system ATPase subunit
VIVQENAAEHIGRIGLGGVAHDSRPVAAPIDDLVHGVGDDGVVLKDRIDHKIGELSGGEQQRVALARAIIMEPALLLADEPTGNLDPVTGNTVFDLIKEMNRDFGLSTIMVTHNYELAGQMDRCFTLTDGILIEADKKLV